MRGLAIGGGRRAERFDLVLCKRLPSSLVTKATLRAAINEGLREFSQFAEANAELINRENDATCYLFQTMQRRLDAAGLGHEVVLHTEIDPDKRRPRFRDPPIERLVIGAVEIKTSSGLRLSTAKKDQFAGDCRRLASRTLDGGVHAVFIHRIRSRDPTKSTEAEEAVRRALGSIGTSFPGVTVWPVVSQRGSFLFRAARPAA